jgi:hypothetical protein
MGFKQSTSDPGVYLRKAGTDEMVVAVTWVDDIVIAYKLPHHVEVESGLEQHMQSKRQGDLKHHLGMEIQNKLLLTQKTYIEDVLNRFGMENCKGHRFLSTPRSRCPEKQGRNWRNNTQGCTKRRWAVYSIWLHAQGQTSALQLVCWVGTARVLLLCTWSW